MSLYDWLVANGVLQPPPAQAPMIPGFSQGGFTGGGNLNTSMPPQQVAPTPVAAPPGKQYTQPMVPGGAPMTYTPPAPPNIEYLPPEAAVPQAPGAVAANPTIYNPTDIPRAYTPGSPPTATGGVPGPDPGAAMPIGGTAAPSPANPDDKMKNLVQALAGLQPPPQRPPIGVATPPPPRAAPAPTDILSLVLAMGGMAPKQGPRLGG